MGARTAVKIERARLFLMLGVVTACAADPPHPEAAESPKTILSGPLADMPHSVGGFDFGIRLDEFVERCKAAGGRGWNHEGTAVCTEPAVDTGLPVATIFANSCGTIEVCEIALSLSPLPFGALARRVLEKYEGKYGHPNGPGMSVDSLREKCAEGESHKTIASWFFGPKQVPARPNGLIRVVVVCDKGPGISIFYDDEAGVRMRMADANKREENY